MTTENQPTRLEDYIKELLPGAHGHQIKAIATFVATIIAKQSGCQAELARAQGNQEAAVKRLSRLLHNERIRPKDFAEWLCRQALEQLPRRGKVRLTIDWTKASSTCWSFRWSSVAGQCRSSGAPMSSQRSKGA